MTSQVFKSGGATSPPFAESSPPSPPCSPRFSKGGLVERSTQPPTTTTTYNFQNLEVSGSSPPSPPLPGIPTRYIGKLALDICFNVHCK
jgi:hypothetical protein